jgi:phosphate/sulfate permease
VATIIYTNAMKSRNAIIMSGLLNFLGAVVVGTAVAMIKQRSFPPM